MSVWTSLITGSSGLGAYGEALQTVGDNIANVSTVGYKASRAGFADVLGGMAPNGQRLGAGVRNAGPQLLLGQGSVQQTGRSFDLAVQGRGFFAVRGLSNGVDGSWFTRDGRFGLDTSGYVINTTGLRLQGYAIDSLGQLASAPDDLQLDFQSPPQATTEATLALNLDSTAAVSAGWDPADPAGTSQWSTAMSVFDSLGNEHRATVYFVNNGSGQWDWHAMVDGAEVNGGTAGTPFEIGTGSLTFNTDGALQTEVLNTITVDFLGATPGQLINLDMGDAIDDGGTGLAGSTQFAAAFNVTGTTQNGFASGALVDVQLSETGVIRARYSNGASRDVARVALANFGNEDALARMGNQLFAQSSDSGEPLLGAAGDGSRGIISAGAVEGSNVDLGDQLVTLIAYQRAFQANARTVTTADEMLAEIANLKR